MGDIVDLFEYWQDEPPAHAILAARYLDRKQKRSATAPETESQMFELQKMMDTRMQPMPAHLKEMAAWAAEQQKLMGR